MIAKRALQLWKNFETPRRKERKVQNGHCRFTMFRSSKLLFLGGLAVKSSYMAGVLEVNSP